MKNGLDQNENQDEIKDTKKKSWDEKYGKKKNGNKKNLICWLKKNRYICIEKRKKNDYTTYIQLFSSRNNIALPPDNTARIQRYEIFFEIRRN